MDFTTLRKNYLHFYRYNYQTIFITTSNNANKYTKGKISIHVEFFVSNSV